MQNFQIFYIFVLRAEKVTIFCSEKVTFPVDNTNIYIKLANFTGLYIRYFTTFRMQLKTLHFYSFLDDLSSCDETFCFSAYTS